MAYVPPAEYQACLNEDLWRARHLGMPDAGTRRMAATGGEAHRNKSGGDAGIADWRPLRPTTPSLPPPTGLPPERAQGRSRPAQRL